MFGPAMSTLKARLLGALMMVLVLPAMADAPGQYLSLDDFLAQSFAGSTPVAKVAWLDSDTKARIKEITGKEFPLLRVRYWQQADRTAWVLEEIGKEMPITIGVVVADQQIKNIEVLAFRETRGWEIRHEFFTRQFQGTALDERSRLNTSIDGITGATLSVRAMKHVARLALLLAETLATEPAG